MEIPTKTIKVLNEDVIIKEWLTQEQEDTYNKLILGDQTFDISSAQNESMSIMIDPSKIAEARKFLVEALCTNLTWEEYNTRSPQFRAELFNLLGKIQNPKKK